MLPGDSTQTPSHNLHPLLSGLAIFYFLLEWIVPTLGDYGYFIDEFYYLACADHLSLGYVDHPPLSVFLLWIVRGILGDSLIAIRFVPALAGGFTVLVVGIIARSLGANALGQILAAGAMMTGLVYQIVFSYFSMNALSILLWAVGFLILVKIEKENEPRWWLVFGMITGLGLLNKHTFILFPAGLFVGLLLTPARRHLTSRWLWAGCLIAICLFVPNLIWQMTNGWPSIEFYRNADFYKNVPTPPQLVLLNQILAVNPGTLIVWVTGLVFLLVSKRGQPLRHLGWIYPVLLVLMFVSQNSRPDRIAEAYIILFGVGGTYLSSLCSRKPLGWLQWAIPTIFVITGLALVPLSLPLLPVNETASYAATLGVVPQVEKSEGEKPQLPLWLGHKIGWERFVDDIEAVASELDPAELQRAVILVPTYGQAGATELLGRGRQLPPVYATQNNYFHWGPPPDPVKVAIMAGFAEETVRSLFGEAEVVRIHDCDRCIRWRDDMPIWIARNPKMALKDVWPLLRHYE
ncbi:MAG: glycosyltransferase family 39 protein [Candidatus Zixiibacteriota bacterium]|nr:MAG: glycosyltransferase family 39 protein [candidate division Zixibacteria bacterium]